MLKNLERLGLERRLANKQRVKNATNGPDINFVGMALLVEHLGRDVVWCAAQCLLALPVKFQCGGKSEVTNFHLHFLGEEKIAQLQVAMDYSLFVQVFAAEDNLG